MKRLFTSVAWIRAFNINELIYAELCHKFYSTYEFYEVCAYDELQTKKIIEFRLGGHAYNFTLLEFAQWLGLYQTVELDEEGFNVYFEGGLRSDENFNAQGYWLSISREENLGLSRSHTSTIKSPILRTPKWVCECGLVDCKVDEEERSWTYMIGWVIWRYVKRLLRGWSTDSHINGTVLLAVSTSTTVVSTVSTTAAAA
ncbi:hypothetical protein Tco_0508577 [Tanacetum coccineum]